MLKRLLLVLLMLLAIGLVACGGDEGEPAAEGEEAGTEEEEAATGDADCAQEDVICIGLVTDVGEIDDKSFNQSSWEGVLLAEEEYGAVVDFIETQDAKDYAANIGLFAGENYDIIVIGAMNAPGGSNNNNTPL